MLVGARLRRLRTDKAISREEAATAIRAYEGHFIPGLLQTEDYMRALIGAAFSDGSKEEVERRVTLRLMRQTLLRQPQGPWLWAVVDEAALRRQVGGREGV